MTTSVPIAPAMLQAQLLCSDDGSPLGGLASAKECLDHLLDYYELPQSVVLQLLACGSHIEQAELAVRMAAAECG